LEQLQREIGNDRPYESCCNTVLQVRLRQRSRVPLQSLHLQELQLLI